MRVRSAYVRMTPHGTAMYHTTLKRCAYPHGHPDRSKMWPWALHGVNSRLHIIQDCIYHTTRPHFSWKQSAM